MVKERDRAIQLSELKTSDALTPCAEDSYADMPTDQTPEDDFAQLLAWLGPDEQQAGAKYEHIRRSLLEYFRRRQALDPPSLADEVFARVTKNVHAVAENYVGEPAHYFLAVARRVLAEWRRKHLETELPQHLAALPVQ